MSPRRTRAATAVQSTVSTRSQAQKINNVNQDVVKSAQKIRQSQRKERTTSVKDNLETTTKQSTSKKKSNTEVTFTKSAKRTRRKLNLDEEIKTENIHTISRDRSMDSNDSFKVLKNECNNSIPIVELIRSDMSRINISKDLNLEEVPRKLQRKASATNIKIPSIIVTPKSTPPKLSLTPHRSKKTPKKSPIFLGSPKTHSLAVPKLLKSPRKLSLTTTSEENLEKSNSNSHNKKSRKKNRRHDDSGDSTPSQSMSKSLKTKKQKKSDINLKTFVRKFSKSSKIVLRSPESKNSKSRKLKLLSPSRAKKSPLKSISPSFSFDDIPKLDSKSSKNNIKKSPKKKNSPRAKRNLLYSRLTKILSSTQIKDVLGEPIVLVEKLSSEGMKRQNMVAKKTQSNTSIGVKSPLISPGSNSKVSLPIKRASSPGSNSKVSLPIKRASTGSNISTNRNSSIKLRNNSIEKSPKISPRIKCNTLWEKNKSSTPLMSSTPQAVVALTDISLESNTSIASVNNMSLTKLRHRNNRSNVQLSNTINKDMSIENVSRPSLLDKDISNTSQSRFSSAMKQNTTYDKDMENKQENKKNNTYELEQPQTQNLQQMIRKRTSIDANLSAKSNAKKAKVRFADVTSRADSAQRLINKLNGSRSNISHNVSTQRKNNVTNSAHKSKKVETLKFNQNSLSSPFNTRLNPRLLVDTPRNQITPKSLASVEKKSEKKSSTKKVPNFGRIHEQMFAKSESLIDAKKRLEARHLAFTTNKAVPKVDIKKEERKPLPTDTSDGVHNRFGFKVKKVEATQLMKKQPAFSREKQQEKTRMMLKGVRTNRRFDLQMKARNINL
ncbi:cylicin-1-like [Pogonomyrmex barbatus]|uniref:Cylicin-1-like n=1 Tax=Pogonomyrmex barbatus TaxID=144034 RepID=A0A6I9W0H6_9HYME|nr:cylicin-1-like [Pogonomyrmex barbatus]